MPSSLENNMGTREHTLSPAVKTGNSELFCHNNLKLWLVHDGNNRSIYNIKTFEL